MAEGDRPKVDGDIFFASEFNRADAELRWLPIMFALTTFNSILPHTASVWSQPNGTNTLRTTDAGANWAAVSTDNADMTGVSRVSKADKTKAICCDHDSGNISISSDSGDNWASASTDPASITRVLDLSFPTATVAVVACDLGGASRGIFFSTDAGDTWTICSTGPGVDVFAIDMVDGSNGFAIDASQNVWTTSDGGDNWTDSTFNTNGSNAGSSMVALTSSTYVTIAPNSAELTQTGTDSAAAIRRLGADAAVTAQTRVSNLIKSSNGNLYFALYGFKSDSALADNSSSITMYKSEDSGVTWQISPLTFPGLGVIADFSTNDAKSELVEYDTNKFLLKLNNTNFMLIDESWDA